MQVTRPFPGISFRVETPTTVALPRMDVAAFVGFAQQGPLHRPVVVESYPEFVNLFGGVYRLAWDDEENLWQTACLTPAVKDFFAQGGRRCWIVRVANPATAQSTLFPLAGLVQTTLTGYTEVTATARCPGSWADDLETRVELLVTPLGIATAPDIVPGAPPQVELRSNQQLQPGDLVQLDFSDRKHRAYGVVPNNNATLSFDRSYWFHRLLVSQLPLAGTVQAGAESSMAGTLATTESFDGQAADPLTPNNIQDTVLNLTGSGTLVAVPGQWLRLETTDAALWLLIGASIRDNQLTLADIWVEGADPLAGPLSLERAQQVQMALRARRAEGENALAAIVLNLAGASPHPRFMGNLPGDDELFRLVLGPAANRSSSESELWQEVRTPRFPLSVNLGDDSVVLPLGLDRPIPWQTGRISTGEPLVRDGIIPDASDYVALTGENWSEFLPELFLDPVLRYTSVRSLPNEISDRLYIQEQNLSGVHALWPIDEISLVALPDAAHRGWRLTQQISVAIEPPPAEPEIPDPCAKESPFVPCPQISSEDEDSSGNEESLQPVSQPQWQLLSSLEYQERGLLTIQQAVARLAAARSDMVAVLGLPKHYRSPDVLVYQQQLLEGVRRDGDTVDSYLALYHSWLVSRHEPNGLIHTHPAGAMVGVMAARSLNRGAWVAPANEVVQGVLATLPPLSLTEQQTLYAAGINPIRQAPQGFVAWGSYTQSLEPELEDLNVRRLMILLRRLALQEGEKYVFAPHSAAFRRRVQQQFEQVLARLFDLGAFAGRDPTEAYQVVIDGTLNTQTTVERGQLIIELRVAPSQPMTFITVRLVQLDNNRLTVQEVLINGG
ncbi:MAG: hypothetical protein AAF821_13500 [Cyanobacteria bacterium P01_D01_bin.156]